MKKLLKKLSLVFLIIITNCYSALADLPVSQLPPATSFGPNDVFYLVTYPFNGSSSKQISGLNTQKTIWANITGAITINSSGVSTLTSGSVSNVNINPGVDAAKIADGSVSNSEFQTLDGITSSIQDQLDEKANLTGATFTGDIFADNLSGTNTGDVTITGENYISLSDQEITVGAVNLSGSNVTGNLPVNKLNSGTSASSSTYWRGDGTWASITSTTPGGSNSEVQYNNAGVFGGISGATTDGATLTLTNPIIDNRIFGTSGTPILSLSDGGASANTNIEIGAGVNLAYISLAPASGTKLMQIDNPVGALRIIGHDGVELQTADTTNNWISLSGPGSRLVHFIMQNGTSNLTLPLGTDTLVGKATTDTLTNKTLTSQHLTAGTATAGTAPIYFAAGTNLTSAAAGAMEWDGTNLFITQTSGPTRKTISYTSDIPTTAGTTYTPTLTNVTNVTSSTPHICQYTRIASVVTAFCSVDVTTTLAVATELDISLPVASNFAASTDANGLGQASSAIATNAYIDADTTNDRVRLKFIGLSVGGVGTIFLSFSYSVI